MDFTAKHENGDGLLNSWENEVPKIISFLGNGTNIKDKTIRFLVERLKHENIDDSKYLLYYNTYIYINCITTS